MSRSSPPKKKQTIPAPQPNVLERQAPAQHPVIRHQQTVQTVRTIFDPDVLERYRQMVPDAPERVLRQFELNSETERAIMQGSLDAKANDNRRRDWMAFAIIITGLVVSAVMAALGVPWLSGVTLAAIIGYAVVGYLKSKPEKPPKGEQS